MLLTLGCQTMREGVVASLIFFLAGVMLILVAMHVLPQIWNLQHIVMFFGFILLLLSPIILLSTFLISVLPKSKEKMDKCDH
ncbi:MAG: hypothetical protein HOM14_18655 [Gammaproteobacteria bacterium]|jgi:hypothetical protein|nr:hypothetical protein [Gammaproteobacteria bacterium]MBT3724156.1 hypothetical protein [Gammaproteobacteria bacterium]MBT4076588.1 hypothetical protein [Gammaproteobacteria bacterium]MBT4194745.1 hypothetical protein [Gammaproteobacteria bacterium]MBT4450390.1 hypothetical protein [Gammaproteobacteria bacterium]